MSHAPTITEEAIKTLRLQVQGAVFVPGDEGYDDARAGSSSAELLSGSAAGSPAGANPPTPAAAGNMEPTRVCALLVFNVPLR